MSQWLQLNGAYVSPEAELDEGVALEPGAVIYPRARIGAGSAVGAGAVIHAATVIGAGSLIEPGAVLGKQPRLRRGSSAAGISLEPLRVGEEVTVCAGAVVYAGAQLEDGAIVGDQAQVREKALVGARSVVGRASCVDFGARLGERVLMQTAVYMTAGAFVEDDVFVGPGVTTTNDNAMGRLPKGQPLQGPTLRRACRIGGGVVLVPGVEVGEEAFVGAGALVTRDVAPREVVLGFPARARRRVPDEDLLERWR